MLLQRHLHREDRDAELAQEISFFLETATEDNIGRGMSPEEARRAACRKFGNGTFIREEVYRMSTIGFLDTLRRDALYGMRTLRLNPMFSAAALLTLAVGIGANTAVFSVVNGVLLKPLAYPKPEELVELWQAAPGAAGIASVSDGLRLSPSMYFTYAEQNRTLQAMGVWFPGTANVTGLAEPEQVLTVGVSDGVLQALNVRPVLGRWLLQADQKPGAPETVILSYGYWQRRFGGDKSIIGRGIRVESRPREIVGVMPRGFKIANADSDLIVPLAFDRSKVSLPGFGFQGIARLKPGRTIAEANRDLKRLLPVWMDSWPFQGNHHIYESWKITPALRPLKQKVIGGVGNVLWVVMGTIGIVMLIACANVANLLLVRAEGRQQELAIRAAIGAGWGRIVRELLLESVLLGLMGGVLGLGLAYAGLRFLVSLQPASLPRLDEISIDPRVLGFTLIVSVLSGLLFGLIPAFKYAGPRISNALRGGGRNASQSRERHRTRNILVVAQVALALVLLVSSGLMIRTFQALRTVEPGFTHAEQLETMRISIPESLISDPVRVKRIQNDILDKLAGIPGVTSVGFESAMPMEGMPPSWDNILLEGQNYDSNEIPPLRLYKNVSPGLFQTAGTRLIAGRDLTWTEVYGHRAVALISENLAREIWGTPRGALGKRFHQFPGDPWREVIGVVQDVRENGVNETAPATVYWPPIREFNLGGPSGGGPGRLFATPAVTVVVRSPRAGTESFLNGIRKAVWSVNSSLPVASIRTMKEVYDQSLSRTSFTLVMLGIAGAMAMLLGIIGIYGVISYAVSQRRREIGIRLALGVQRGELTRMFVRYGIALASIGVAVGLGAALGLSRLMSSLLFGISPFDPLTYIAVAVVLALAVVLASYLPARAASAVDPVEALRAQ
jgi:predicted permease